MRTRWYLAGAAAALTSTLALAAPESLLPPVFQQPAPTPAPSPPADAASRPARAPGPASAPRSGDWTPGPGSAAASGPAAALPGEAVVQPLPDRSLADAIGPDGLALPPDFPSLAELEAMDEDEIDAVLGLQPKFDIPPAARRAVEQVGIVSQAEGGFPANSLASQPAALVRAALAANRGPVVSRWGHILLRRALASRLESPRGMDPVQFATLRAALLGRMGEGMAARALVQDVDSANYDRPLADAAFAAYLATGDLLGMCPVAQVRGDLREDAHWEMMQAICDAFAGQERSARRRLDRALGTGAAPAIDVRLAQRFAGAAGEGRRAVNIEWDNVDELTPWRHSLARALGVDLPEALLGNGRYDLADALIPAVPLLQRVAAADRAAARGVLSSAAMVDLYAQAFASDQLTDADKQGAQTLRDAYVTPDPAARMAAIRTLWDGPERYGREVLTAYAAARMPVDEALLGDASGLFASMLAAGLDRNAMRWAPLIEAGSAAWGLLVFAQGAGAGQVGGGAVSGFMDEDRSAGQRKSRFLVAGLAGLGRLDEGTAADLAGELGIDLQRRSDWSVRIDRAGELRNGALVALLAGIGMQGEGWERMTARHLFHIVRALDRAGLNAEARMIAAEAVARA